MLRERGLAAALASRPGFTDAGDITVPAPQPRRGPSGLLAEDALIAMIEGVRGAVRAARARRRFPLLAGGDCPVILGALAALQAEREQPGLLFIDGHELAAVDCPQPGGLTWEQLSQITITALAAQGCAGWSVCIYNPDLDPDRDAADAIIKYLTQSITAADPGWPAVDPTPG